jgi:hypothetical protein
MKVLQRLEEIDRIEPYGWKGVTYSWGRKSYEMKMFLKERNLLRNVIPREPAGERRLASRGISQFEMTEIPRFNARRLGTTCAFSRDDIYLEDFLIE